MPAGGSTSLEVGASYVRSVQQYRVPEVVLTDAHAREVDLHQALGGSRNAIVSFVFTTCAGVCPMISATMVQAQPALDQIDEDYEVFLVSLDPEHDTPARLNSYARRFKVGSRVHFLTGESEDIFAVLRAFGAVYEGGNRMNHTPITLVRASGNGAWLRLEGMVDGKALAAEYGKLVNSTRDATARVR